VSNQSSAKSAYSHGFGPKSNKDYDYLDKPSKQRIIHQEFNSEISDEEV